MGKIKKASKRQLSIRLYALRVTKTAVPKLLYLVVGQNLLEGQNDFTDCCKSLVTIYN